MRVHCHDIRQISPSVQSSARQQHTSVHPALSDDSQPSTLPIASSRGRELKMPAHTVCRGRRTWLAQRKYTSSDNMFGHAERTEDA